MNGEVIPIGANNCTCYPGWVGINCDSECSDHGKIVDGECDCDVNWWGSFCDVPGCPGIGESCSKHGICNSITHNCDCFPGWTGDGCELPDCPGEPDCNDRGNCNSTLDPPKCLDCISGWMGPACADFCVNGTQVPHNSGHCECHSCYNGLGCNLECNGHGKCNGTHCICDMAWRGSKCEIQGCPGVTEDCTQHGTCNSALQLCTCIPGMFMD